MEQQMVFSRRELVMQRLADAVSQGYTSWVSGSVSIERAKKLVKKFELTFQTNVDRNLRARRKRAGLGNAKLILWRDRETIFWFLLVTSPDAGDHPAHSIEKLRNAFDPSQRIEIDGFELVRLPKKGSGKKGTSLTWRMNDKKLEAWRDSIRSTVRKGSPRALHELLRKLWSSPGFYGVRSQVGHLVAFYRGECRRSSRKDAPSPPKRLPYLRRLKNFGDTLPYLVSQTKAR
jgi:hypothetical protein